MTTLQTDLLSIYNALVAFSQSTVVSKFPLPIKVHYEESSMSLVFEQKGTTVYVRQASYYSLALKQLTKPTYLLPEDYDYLQSTLQTLIGTGALLKPRTCLSPENYGFDIYEVDERDPRKEIEITGQIRFVSGTSWLFKYLTKRKYNI